MAPGDELPLTKDVRVNAFPSTDLGVSYLVDFYGTKVFHAGDLNLWHWRTESTLKEIEAAETAYESALQTLKGQSIDIAMFPVDPRQGAMYDAGANAFILSIKPLYFIPMHWQKRPEVATDFARRAQNKQTTIVPLTQPGDAFYFERTEDGKVQHHSTAQTPLRRTAPIPALGTVTEAVQAPAVQQNVYSSDDPFSESDLPVELS